MKTEFLDSETTIKSGFANMQRGAEAVGGKLYLTSLRLIFESHKLNIQTGTTIIPLQEISETTPCWTKFLNLVPLFPNSLAVVTSGGEERFVLYGRKTWKRAIDDQRNQSRAQAG